MAILTCGPAFLTWALVLAPGTYEEGLWRDFKQNKLEIKSNRSLLPKHSTWRLCVFSVSFTAGGIYRVFNEGASHGAWDFGGSFRGDAARRRNEFSSLGPASWLLAPL